MPATAAPTIEPEATQQPQTPATPAPATPGPADDADPLYSEDRAGDPPEDPPEEGAGDEGDEDHPAPEGASDEGDAGGEALSTVDQLLEQTQLDPETFGKLKINVKVDGVTTPVPVSDLLKSYQIGEAATKRLEDAKVKAAALTSDAEAKREAVHANLSVVAKLVKSAEDLLDADVNKINWDKLRVEDPAEYAAKKDEVRERRDRIKALKDEGKKAWSDAVAAQREGARAALGETIADQKAKLLEAIPSWSNPETAKAESAKMTDFLVNHRGFSREEIANTTDYRLLVLARDAWQNQTLQSKAAAAKKKVATVPKTLRPGSQGNPPKPKEKTLLEDLYG